MRIPTNQPPVHPGEILLEEFIKPYGTTPADLCQKIDISPEQINAVINGTTGMSTDLALVVVTIIWYFARIMAFWSNEMGYLAFFARRTG